MRAHALLLSFMVLAMVAPSAALAKAPAGGTAPAPAPAPTPPPSGDGSGGAQYGVDPSAPPRQYVPGTKAKRLANGLAAAPQDAPVQVQQAIFAANEIVGMPYSYGGGHDRSFKSAGYDCSGTISYALHGAGLLDSPLDSSSFMRWGATRRGSWITVYSNPGHAFVVIAGLRLDTSAAGERRSSGKGPRWRSNARPQQGYTLRHPAGL